MKIRIDSLYICVKDMNRAILFYEQLFEQPVTEQNDVYSVFDVNGFRFGLFAHEKTGEKHTFGNSCLPSISFESREELEKKLSGKEICFPLTQIKRNWVAEIVDSEGNHIEITAPV